MKRDGKVHIFWEGRKILPNLHITFDWHYITQDKSKVKISQNFVAFSEYMNFKQKKEISSNKYLFPYKYGNVRGKYY